MSKYQLEKLKELIDELIDYTDGYYADFVTEVERDINNLLDRVVIKE
jgi:hypothetical protein